MLFRYLLKLPFSYEYEDFIERSPLCDLFTNFPRQFPKDFFFRDSLKNFLQIYIKESLKELKFLGQIYDENPVELIVKLVMVLRLGGYSYNFMAFSVL